MDNIKAKMEEEFTQMTMELIESVRKNPGNALAQPLVLQEIRENLRAILSWR